MSSGNKIVVWDPLLRLLHWVFFVCFILNYWVLETGGLWHRITGLLALTAVLCRLFWGFYGPANARFSVKALSTQRWRAHLRHIRQRQFDPRQGHNPFGYVLLYAVLTLFAALAVTGLLLEEVDYFFGSDRLERIHGTLADIVFVLACTHIAAVFIMQWWGKVALIKPMLTGKRRL